MKKEKIYKKEFLSFIRLDAVDRFLLRAAGETAAHGILYSYNLKALKDGERMQRNYL